MRLSFCSKNMYYDDNVQSEAYKCLHMWNETAWNKTQQIVFRIHSDQLSTAAS